MTADERVQSALTELLRALADRDKASHLAGLAADRDHAARELEVAEADVTALTARLKTAKAAKPLRFRDDAAREVALLEDRRQAARTAADARAVEVQLGAARSVLQQATEHAAGESDRVAQITAELAGAKDRQTILRQALSGAQSALDTPGRPPVSHATLDLIAAWYSPWEMVKGLPGLTAEEDGYRGSVIRHSFHNQHVQTSVPAPDFRDVHLQGVR